jgi:Domain of unknown function (DUF6249)
MEVLLLPSVILAVWLVLGHIRKQQFLKEYMALQHEALEKGVALPGDLKDLATVRTDWAAVSLRLGIISVVLGIMGVIIGMYLLPSQLGPSKDADVVAILVSFWAIGLLLAAFGLGNLICWLMIDRRRATRGGKGE